jgi:hypothetical protein
MIAEALALAKLVPGLVGLFKGDDDAPLAEKVINIAKTVTGLDSPHEQLAALTKDPALLVQFQAQAAQVAIEELRAETEQLKSINETMRVEYASGDKFKSYWRPAFGWSATITWVIQTAAIVAVVCYAVFARPDKAGDIINAVAALVGALGVQWSVALMVLGVNITKRSQDKQAAVGIVPPTGILGALTQRIAGKA